MTATEGFAAGLAEAYASGDAHRLAALYDPAAVIHHPLAAAPLSGSQIAQFGELTAAAIPDIECEITHWAARDDVLFVEWTCTGTMGNERLTWSGADRLVVRDGHIVEEFIYYDTLPLRAAMGPSMERGPLVNLD